MTTPGKQQLRLLSYNIQAGIASVRFRHYLTNAWKHVLPHPKTMENLRLIAQLARDFDVVALQEVDSGSLRSAFVNQVEYIAMYGHFPFWHHQTNRDFGKFAQYSNGLLSKIRPDEITEHKLPGIVPGRGVILARYGQGEHPLIVVQAHLSLGRRARALQLEFIKELIAAHKHVVLMGDLNCQTDSGELNRLLDCTALCELAETTQTFPSWKPSRCIDHILVSTPLNATGMPLAEHKLSDHLPIAVTIDIPNDVGLLRD